MAEPQVPERISSLKPPCVEKLVADSGPATSTR